jgi:hypothetical protein
MLDIYLKCDKPTTGITCARIDYMGDHQPSLVEFNLMSVGLNGISDRVQDLQNIIGKYRHPIGKYTYPTNYNQSTICSALITAL